MFLESSAPTGWTKLTTHDNKALRVVTGTGGGFGSGGTSGAGGSPFTSTFSQVPVTGTVTASGTVGGHTLSIAELPAHAHGAGDVIGINPQPGSGVSGRDLNVTVQHLLLVVVQHILTHLQEVQYHGVQM